MPVIAWLVAIGVGLVVSLVTYGVALGRGDQIVTPIWFAAPDLLVALAVAGAAVRLDRQGHRRLAGWLLATSCSLIAYAVLGGSAALLRPAGGAFLPWLVALEGAWFMLPILLCGACCLVAAEELSTACGSLRWGWRVPAALVGLGILTGLGAVDPASGYPELSAPLADTPVAGPVGQVVFGLITVAWMLSTGIAPLLVLRAARRASGLPRGRLTVVCIAAAAPLLTLVTCLLLGAAVATGVLDELAGRVVVSIAFLLPPGVVAIGVLAATTARDDGVTGRVGFVARRVLQVLWLTVGAQLATLLAALVANGLGRQSETLAATVAVVLTVVFVAAYVPVAARVESFMAVAEPLSAEQPVEPWSGVLTPREREVLGLIAEGRSNAAIAAALVLSERTIDSHVRSIFDKLGLGREAGNNRRVQAAAAWIRVAQTSVDRSTVQA